MSANKKVKALDVALKIAKWAFVVTLVFAAGLQFYGGNWVAGVCTLVYIVLIVPPIARLTSTHAKVIFFVLVVMLAGGWLQDLYDKRVLKLGYTEETVLEIVKIGPSPHPKGKKINPQMNVYLDGWQIFCDGEDLKQCLQKIIDVIEKDAAMEEQHGRPPKH